MNGHVKVTINGPRGKYVLFVGGLPSTERQSIFFFTAQCMLRELRPFVHRVLAFHRNFHSFIAPSLKSVKNNTLLNV